MTSNKTFENFFGPKDIDGNPVPWVGDRPTLSLDFDGVCHAYTTEFSGSEIIPDGPVAGFCEFLSTVVEDFVVAIFSSRSSLPEGREAMRKAVTGWMIEYDKRISPYVMGSVYFPIHKPQAFVSIDDRAIKFTGKWPSVDELKAFKTWQQPASPYDMVPYIPWDAMRFLAIPDIIQVRIRKTGDEAAIAALDRHYDLLETTYKWHESLFTYLEGRGHHIHDRAVVGKLFHLQYNYFRKLTETLSLTINPESDYTHQRVEAYHEIRARGLWVELAEFLEQKEKTDLAEISAQSRAS